MDTNFMFHRLATQLHDGVTTPSCKWAGTSLNPAPKVQLQLFEACPKLRKYRWVSLARALLPNPCIAIGEAYWKSFIH
ncbi:hypothetical protein PSAC2689_180052 [Paraburkholderia sacchari]